MIFSENKLEEPIRACVKYLTADLISRSLGFLREGYDLVELNRKFPRLSWKLFRILYNDNDNMIFVFPSVVKFFLL